MHGPKKIVIAAESNKFVDKFSWPVPIEVSPFAISIVTKELEQNAEGRPKLRMLNEGYPYVTENGNFILDTRFDFSTTSNIRQKEVELKTIPGIIEVAFLLDVPMFIIKPITTVPLRLLSYDTKVRVLIWRSVHFFFPF